MKVQFKVFDGNDWREEILDTDNLENDSRQPWEINMVTGYLEAVYGNKVKNIEEVF